jgi:transitional endoplasmic reticulum ATPase
LQVDLPDYNSRRAILEIHNRDRPLDGVNLEEWAQTTECWNGADLELLSNQAALSAVREATSQGISDPTQVEITPQDFQVAYERLLKQRSSSPE